MKLRILLPSLLILLGAAAVVHLRSSAEPEEPRVPAADSVDVASGPRADVAVPDPPPTGAGRPADSAPSGPGAGELASRSVEPPADPLGAGGGTEPPAAGDDDDAVEDPAELEDIELRTIWSVDRQGIDSAVREALPELKECYEEWLKLDPDISGRVLFELVIDVPQDGEAAEDGTPLAAITDVAIADSTMEHPFMEGCAANVFADLWFSPPEDGPVRVTYPVVLDRGAE